MNNTIKTHTLILGAGSAGCVLANRLSKDPDREVVLVEGGGEDRWHWIHIPVGYLYTMGNPKTDWCYHTTAQPGLNGRKLAYPRGKTLGGSSSINGMIYMRGQIEDYTHWGPGWSWDEILPYYRRSETYHGGEDDYHGADGELHVQRQRLKWPILEQFKSVCESHGFSDRPDFNRGINEGVGYFEVNQKRGRRWSSARAFLHPVRHRKNLDVMTHTLIDTLLFKGTRCVGARVIKNGQVTEIKAKEVVLSTGAVATPVILERSGIGQETVLSAHGITPYLCLPGVGENLQDHLQIRLQYRLAQGDTLNTQANSWLGRLKMAAQYAVTQSGPLSMAPSQLGAFFKSSDLVDRADLEFHVQPMTADKLGTKLHPFPGITTSVCHLRPASRGSIHLGGPSPDAPPIIDPRYLSESSDRDVALNAMRKTRELMQDQALVPFGPSELKPGADIQSDEALLKAAGDLATTIFHPVGTAKMGDERDPMAVVSHDLKVHGVDNLYIADASIMPTITSGNTHAPTVMIAERLSEWLSAR